MDRESFDQLLKTIIHIDDENQLWSVIGAARTRLEKIWDGEEQ